ncbi:MAG: hypothetical protein CMB78_03110 [Euryarchaeota archaeon]|nr:hypothetical protein [Euryarchaeota archaeon]
MAEPPIEFWVLQLAFAIGLLGIYAGWRGNIAKMTGFYDLSGAVRTLLFGLVSGGLAAWMIDLMLLANIRDSSLNIISVSVVALFIALAESSLALLILGRSRTVGLRACAPYGWTFGLGFGAIRSAHLNVRLFDQNVWEGTTGFTPLNIFLACLLALTTCVGHASIASWQGSRLVEGERIRSLLPSTFSRAALIIITVLTVFYPLTIALVVPIVAWSWFPAQESWLPSGLTPAAKQAYRRTLRQSDLHKSRAESRIRGETVKSDE